MTRRPDTLAARLVRLREASGLSASELARQAGVSRQMLHKLESGQQADPRFSVVVRVCRALDTPLDSLADLF